jgi:hypothetical protein
MKASCGLWQGAAVADAPHDVTVERQQPSDCGHEAGVVVGDQDAGTCSNSHLSIH